jgi:hypothetical protein
VPRYPLAYSLEVLPISIARWSLNSHKNVASATIFFGETVYNLSGAINVLLFLIVRPQLLLFPRPEDFNEPEAAHRAPSLATRPSLAFLPPSPQYTLSSLHYFLAFCDLSQSRQATINLLLIYPLGE